MSDGKEIRYWMDKSNSIAREAILLRNENIKLKGMLEHSLKTVERLQAENRKLAIASGTKIQAEINKIITDINCF